jgi:hypothetical protein
MTPLGWLAPLWSSQRDTWGHRRPQRNKVWVFRAGSLMLVCEALEINFPVCFSED